MLVWVYSHIVKSMAFFWWYAPAATSIWFEIWGVMDLGQKILIFYIDFFQAISPPKKSIFQSKFLKNIDFSGNFTKISIFQGKFLKNFEFFGNFSKNFDSIFFRQFLKKSIFQGKFQKNFDFFRQFPKKFQFYRQKLALYSNFWANYSISLEESSFEHASCTWQDIIFYDPSMTLLPKIWRSRPPTPQDWRLCAPVRRTVIFFSK